MWQSRQVLALGRGCGILNLAGIGDVQRSRTVTDFAANVTQIGTDTDGRRVCLLPLVERHDVAARRIFKTRRVTVHTVVGSLLADVNERSIGAAVLGGLPQLVGRFVEMTGARHAVLPT